jgi:hypothetical protein
MVVVRMTTLARGERTIGWTNPKLVRVIGIPTPEQLVASLIPSTPAGPILDHLKSMFQKWLWKRGLAVSFQDHATPQPLRLNIYTKARKAHSEETTRGHRATTLRGQRHFVRTRERNLDHPKAPPPTSIYEDYNHVAQSPRLYNNLGD